MAIERLKQSVSKSEERVEKCKATIERHKKQLDKKIKANEDVYEIEWKERDIVDSGKKLIDAERILNNWKSKLDVELEKERFIEGNAPEVIKVFLENWKTKAIEWHLNRYNNYQDFKKSLIEKERQCRIECIKITPEYSRYLDRIEDPESSLTDIRPRNIMADYLEENNITYKHIAKAKANFAGGNVMYMDGLSNETERYDWIERVLEKEKKFKMIDLIHRINNEIGEVTNAGNLEISAKGNLDGVIVGSKGSLKITTIEAGGFNIQCFHYRTLIKKLK